MVVQSRDWRVTWERKTDTLAEEEHWLEEEFVGDEASVKSIHNNIKNHSQFRNVKLWQCKWLPEPE